MEEGPLHGIRVLELGTAIAGPMCGMLLGDMGAEVTKVEMPRRGDDSRNWGQKVDGESPYFLQYNRNKKSITLDIKSGDGRKILLELMKTSDVLIENFRPGTMERLSLSFKEVHALNPGLVYCSVSGFGQTGPYSNLGGYDAIIQAMCGLMTVNGEEDSPPLRVGVPVTDILAAVYAAFSVTLALYARQKTKVGQAVDLSLMEAGILAVAQWITISKITGTRVKRFGNRYPLLAPYEPFPTKDKPMVVAVGNDDQWRKLCEIVGRADLTEDPRFRTNLDRIEPAHRDALTRELTDAFSHRTATEWIGDLWKAGIPSGLINGLEDLATDPQVISRGIVTTVRHEKLGNIQLVAPMPKLSLTRPSVRHAPPTLGQHTEEILQGMGFSAKDILDLRSKGVV